MQDLTERAAYLQGLVDGLDLGKESKEGKVLNGMIGLLHEMAHSVTELEKSHSELETYVEAVDEDLLDLEDEVYEDDIQLTGDEDYEDDYIDVECPVCRETVCFDPEILEDDDVVEVTCPNCDTVVFVNEEAQDNTSVVTSDI